MPCKVQTQDDITQKLLSQYQSRLAKKTAEKDAGLQEQQRQAYRQAAAVLHCFLPRDLNPYPTVSKHADPWTLLEEDTVYASGKFSEGLRTMKPEARKAALKALGSRGRMLEALQTNSNYPMTPLQTMWEAYLRTGVLPDATALGYNDLTALSQIVDWMDGIDPGIYTKQAVEDLVRQKSILANFEHLVISNFTGRTKELQALHNYISMVTQSGSWLGALTKEVGSWFSSSTPNPILCIHGPGGIGKSALLGRMLWENVQNNSEKNKPFAFAYLALDQSTLRIESPFTLLVEAAAQFELQFPSCKDDINNFYEMVRDYRDGRGALVGRRKVGPSRGERIAESQSLDNTLFLEFARLLEKISRTSRPNTCVLLVIDTFEEVQYRDQESLFIFWRMLVTILTSFPSFRVLIAGRAPVSVPDVYANLFTVLPLEQLQQPDRIVLLQQLGVDDPATAAAVAAQVGGNPLSLRLAANLITSDKNEAGTKGIKNLNTKKWLFFQIDEQLIQGQLYKRILDHIHNEDVKKLAHPGMVLRVVDPEVILYVLAPQCGLSITTIDEARQLFDQLRREQALVQTGTEGKLVYRPEIRQAMIRLLQQDKFSDVKALHRAAIAYYSGKPDISEKTEEFYHRLVLDEDDFSLLDSLWQKDMSTSIASNLEEYSDRVKVWLASRINLEMPRNILAGADLSDWERNITRKVKLALIDNQPITALHFLSERNDRTAASPLYALEVKANLLIGDLNRTAQVAEQGIEKLSASNNRGRLAELFWLQSQVQLMQREYVPADESLQQAATAVKNASHPLSLIHIICHRLLLRKYYPDALGDTAIPIPGAPVNGAELRLQLSNLCRRIDDGNVSTMSFVLPMVIFLLENEFPKTTERLKGYVNSTFADDPAILISENLQGLEEYREKWEDEDQDTHTLYSIS
jgi:hypothetical protein